MSYIFTNTQNLAPANGSIAMYNLVFKGLITNAGWILEGAGDGVSNFNNSGSAGSIITGSGTGAHGFNNSGAWARLRTPTGSRELLFQRGNATYNWWVQYSFSAGFTGGSPSATTAPTATDAYGIVGGNSNGVNTFNTNDGSYRQQIACDSASPYGFYSITYPTGGGDCNSIQMMDPMSFDSSDNDPYVFMFSNGNINSNRIFPFGNSVAINCAATRIDTAPGNTSYGIPVGYLGKGQPGEGFVSLSVTWLECGPNISISIPGNVGTELNNFGDVEVPLIWARNSTNYNTTNYGSPTGYKGVSSILRWLATFRQTGMMLTVNTTGDRLVINGVMTLPWNGTTPIL